MVGLQAGLRLAIWNREDIAHDAKINKTVSSPAEFTIGHNVESKREVDKVMEQAKQDGAIITVPSHDTFWGGYSGYFQDADNIKRLPIANFPSIRSKAFFLIHVKRV